MNILRLFIIAAIATLASGLKEHTLATYLFCNLTSADPVPDSEGIILSQPAIVFPVDVNNHPKREEMGVLITKDTYMEIPTPIQNIGAAKTTAALWFYYMRGELGDMAKIGVEFITGTTGIATYVVGSQTGLYYQDVYTKVNAVINSFNKFDYGGWNMLAFGYANNKVYNTLCIHPFSVCTQAVVPATFPSFGTSTGFYLGCKSCADPNVKYIIHSLRISNFESLVAPTLEDAVPNTFALSCGSGVRDPSEVCDDGNLYNGDGCLHTCTKQAGYQCVQDPSPNITSDLCYTCQTSNLVSEPPSPFCDDGNTMSGDSCASDCLPEPMSTCTWDPVNLKSQCQVCGDGVVQRGWHMMNMTCDDGNFRHNDGCNSTCQVEEGWVCEEGSPTTRSRCYVPVTIYDTVTLISLITKILVGVVVLVVVIAAVLTKTSINLVWAVLNQFQLLCLMLMFRMYLPQMIIQYLASNSFALASMNFIPFNKIWFLREASEWMYSYQADPGLRELGMNSKSSFANNINLLCTIVCIALVHIPLIFIPRCKPTAKSGSWQKIYNYLVNKIWKLFTFRIYIRIAVEAQMYILLSGLSELRHYNDGSTGQTVSNLVAFLLLVLCLVLFCLSVYKFFEPDSRSLKEFSKGMKLNRSRLYIAVFLARRIFLVSWVILSQNFPIRCVLVIIVVAQLAYIFRFVCERPYKKTRVNLVEFLNEIFYLVFVTALLYFTYENTWSQVTVYVYLFTICGSLMIVFLVVTITSCVSIIRQLAISFTRWYGKAVKGTTPLTQYPYHTGAINYVRGREEEKASELNASEINTFSLPANTDIKMHIL